MNIETLLVVVTVLLSLTLILLIIGIAVIFRRLEQTTNQIAQTMKSVQESIDPLAIDMRHTLDNIDILCKNTSTQMQRFGKFVEVIEHIVEYKTIAGFAGKAVTSSKVTLVSVLEGLRSGLKVLKSAKQEPKEESSNE